MGGLLVGAWMMALLLSVSGDALSVLGLQTFVAVLVIGAVVVALLQVMGLRAPQSRWQVPEAWRRALEPEILGGLYGILLGIGVLTAVVVSAFWVFVFLTLVVSPAIALLAWTAYALGRAGGFLVLAGLGDVERRLLALHPRAVVLAATAVAVAAAAAHVPQTI